MKLLGDLLVGGKAITAEQRDKAVQHAKKEKMRLGTALLDLGFITEEILLRALSVQRQVPPAPAVELKQIRADILRLVPAKLAARLRVVPFRRAGRQVSLAMRDPNDLPAIDEVSFLTGLPILAHVSPELRIELALFSHYEVEVPERYHRLGKRLEGASVPPPPEPSPLPMTELKRTPSGSFAPVTIGPPAPAPPPAPPPPPQFTGGRAEKSPSGSFPALTTDPWGAGDAYDRAAEFLETYEEPVATPPPAPKPPPPVAPAISMAPPPPAPVPVPAAAPAPLHELDDEDVRMLRGEEAVAPAPVTQSEAHAVETTGEIVPPSITLEPESFDLVARLSSADSRDEVADAVLQAASELVRRAALFIVQADRVIGWAALPEPPEGLRSLQIPFSEPSIFATIRNTEGFYVGPCPDLPANRRALQALGVLGRASIVVVPVTLKGKSVLFLLGEYDSGTPPPAIASLKRLASMTATALEILLLKNRLRQA